MIYDRTSEQPSAFFEFPETDSKVLAVKYGPYDNGHIVLGMQSGALVILDSIKLTKLFHRSVFTFAPLVKLNFDPANLVICTSARGDVAAISLVESMVKYTYLEIGNDRFCTVQQNTTSTRV